MIRIVAEADRSSACEKIAHNARGAKIQIKNLPGSPRPATVLEQPGLELVKSLI